MSSEVKFYKDKNNDLYCFTENNEYWWCERKQIWMENSFCMKFGEEISQLEVFVLTGTEGPGETDAQ